MLMTVLGRITSGKGKMPVIMYDILTVILRENQADSMESQFLGYLEISQSIRKSKVLMSRTRKTTFEEFCHFLFFRERGIKMSLLGNGKYTE